MEKHNWKQKKGNKGDKPKSPFEFKRTDYRPFILKMADLEDSEIKQHLKGLINQIRYYAQNRMGDLSTTQLRNIYGDLLKLDTVEEFQMYRPRLGYIAGRFNKLFPVMKTLEDLINDIETPKHIESFKKFMEMLVCYHREKRGQ